MHGHAQYMRNSTFHWMPLINGYSDYIPPDFVEASIVLQGFPSVEGFRALAETRPRYALFHFRTFGEADRIAVTERIREFAPYLRRLYSDDEVGLYEIVGFPD